MVGGEHQHVLVGLGGELRAVGGGVAAGIDGGIGHRLQELIDDDAARVALDARDVEIEIVDVRRAAGAVHGQVGLEAPLAAVLPTAHDHAATRGVDAAGGGVVVRGPRYPAPPG